MPSADEAQPIAYRNAMKHHIPQIYGAIGGCHIPIVPSLDGYRDYINRKRWVSVILQAVVDDRGLFRNIFAGIPGSSHDGTVLKQSSLFNNPALLPQASKAIDGLDIPLMIVGDPAYPLLPWLIKAYNGPQLTPAQEAFNENLNSIRVSVEHSFGRLKGRCRVLNKRSDIHQSFMPTVIAACCVLHNMCEVVHHTEYVGLPPASDSQPPGQPCEDEFPAADAHSAHLVRNALLEHVQNALHLYIST
ncbi:hypothetical protein ACEWY4_013943 [Coilia grayii]|uniref:DDE Tnp4 domain-containing protein n=1 Tax=Coilia grayii TaxID=363190 RepID=A0ABD1JXX2_9TELE